MKKEELIKLLETLNIEEIKSLKIMYYNTETTTLKINEKGE